MGSRSQRPPGSQVYRLGLGPVHHQGFQGMAFALKPGLTGRVEEGGGLEDQAFRPLPKEFLASQNEGEGLSLGEASHLVVGPGAGGGPRSVREDADLGNPQNLEGIMPSPGQSSTNQYEVQGMGRQGSPQGEAPGEIVLPADEQSFGHTDSIGSRRKNPTVMSLLVIGMLFDPSRSDPWETGGLPLGSRKDHIDSMPPEITPRLLPLFPGTDPYVNLTREEILFETFDPLQPLLLLYVNKDCIVVGKNQNPWRECRVSRMEKDSIPLVRRISGGGTVWHDEGNLNFSLLTGTQAYSKEVVQSYLGRVLDQLGLPWSCNSHGDFFLEGKKFSGHAYAVKKDRVLHHGTLLVQADLKRLKTYLGGLEGIKGPGVASRPSPVVNLGDVSSGLTLENVVEAFRECFEALKDVPASEELAERLELRRSREWILGQTPDFTWEGPQGPVEVKAGRDPGGRWFLPEVSVPEL